MRIVSLSLSLSPCVCVGRKALTQYHEPTAPNPGAAVRSLRVAGDLWAAHRGELQHTAEASLREWTRDRGFP